MKTITYYYYFRVIAFLVLNIIASLFTLCLIVPESIGISIGAEGYKWNKGDTNVFKLRLQMSMILYKVCQQ